MARPLKQGVDYFPLDVSLDDKFELIEAVHGLVGFGIVIKLYQKIYAHSYYIEFTERRRLVFSKRINVDINLIDAVINDSIKWEVFDRVLYKKYMFLTSKGIQSRYFEIVKRRKKVYIDSRALLIDHKLPENVIILVNVDKNSINVDDNSINSRGGTQRERERERERENKYITDSNPSRIANFLFQNILKHKPDFLKPNIQKWSDDADKMLRIDKRDLETVKKLIAWCQADDFEKSNVLSIAKLRKRFDSLEIKMKADGKKKPVKKYKDGERSLAELKAAAIYHEDGTITLRD